MEKIHRIRPTLSTQEAALELRVSETTVKRLVRRDTLHTTKPKKLRGHWASFIIVDKAFREEQHRRLHGLKPPRRKAAAKSLNMSPALDPSPIQTVTPEEEALEKCRNAMNICLEAQKACDKDMQECRSRAAECKGESAHVDEVADACRLHKDSALKCEMSARVCNEIAGKVDENRRDCQNIKDSITHYQHEVDTWAMDKVRTIQASELTCTRCTAILAAACILQLLLAAYYTLCHFNII